MTAGRRGGPAAARELEAHAVDVSNRDGGSQVWVIPASGGEPKKLTSIATEASGVSWSPDGKWIVFSATTARNTAAYAEVDYSLYRVPVEGGEPERLTTGKAAVQDFEWSPDGTRIAYVAAREPTADRARRAGRAASYPGRFA